MATNIRALVSTLCCFVVVVANIAPIACATIDSDVEEQLKVLSKQVTALLERRREDLQIIEESMRKKLTKSQEFEDVREEIKNLR
ncbi:putative signaling receptor binding protein [Trypoxylus dichotomus]